MDTIIIVLLVFIIVIIGLLLLNNSKSNQSVKSSKVKKDQIIKEYEKELKDILEKYSDDKDQQLKQKKLFLQKVTSELARNIYFEPSENKQIIQHLASL